MKIIQSLFYYSSPFHAPHSFLLLEREEGEEGKEGEKGKGEEGLKEKGEEVTGRCLDLLQQLVGFSNIVEVIFV